MAIANTEMQMKSMFILIAGLLIGCWSQSHYKLEGKWQSLNESETVIAFTSHKEIILYRGGKSFWGQITKNGEMKYEITNSHNEWMDFAAFDGDELFTKGRIEIVDDKRIRIYLHKHHNILDLADEYYRTDDFKSYQTIMEKILEEPE